MLMNQFSADTIKRWQTFLIQQGLLEANGADGHFGPNTTAASKAYQIKKGLNPATTDIEATLRAAREDGFEMPAQKSKRLPCTAGCSIFLGLRISTSGNTVLNF